MEANQVPSAKAMQAWLQTPETRLAFTALMKRREFHLTQAQVLSQRNAAAEEVKHHCIYAAIVTETVNVLSDYDSLIQ
jgi:hypothetical protein